MTVLRKNMVLVVKWDERAVADLDTIDFVIAQKIVSKVSWLAEYYANIIPELLHYDLKGVYKLRVGDYRVLYNVSGKIITIKIKLAYAVYSPSKDVFK